MIRAQVQILEVASVQQIVRALKADAYHVLHLSAHGSADSLELEDEDGNPVQVSAATLIDALRRAGRQVPLILMSACSGGPSGAEALGVGLIRRGADRVIAMQAPVTDRYATALAVSLYRELVEDPGQPVHQALSQARWAAKQRLSAARRGTEVPASFEIKARSRRGPYPGSGSSVTSMTDLMKSSTCGVSNRG